MVSRAGSRRRRCKLVVFRLSAQFSEAKSLGIQRLLRLRHGFHGSVLALRTYCETFSLCQIEILLKFSGTFGETSLMRILSSPRGGQRRDMANETRSECLLLRV